MSELAPSYVSLTAGSHPPVVLLASSVAQGYGGVQTVNQLLLSAMREGGLLRSVLALCDPPDAPWTKGLCQSYCAGGSRLRFVVHALARSSGARGAVIFVTHVGLAAVGRILKQVTRGRLLVFLHGAEAWQPWPLRTRWGLTACDKLVANSEFTLARFRERQPGFAHLPMEVCYLPVRRLPEVRPGERYSQNRSSGPRVLILGRLWGRGLLKGQRQLLTIWPDVVSEFPSAQLWVVGEGEGRLELERLASRLGIAEHVRFTGGVADHELTHIYAGSDVFAMPSRGEGFGLVFAEAMAHGLPCIAGSEDAGAEVVVDGETGLVVDPGDLQDLKCALRRLLADASLRARLGEAGRRRASELFSIDGFNRRIQNLVTAPGMRARSSTS